MPARLVVILHCLESSSETGIAPALVEVTVVTEQRGDFSVASPNAYTIQFHIIYKLDVFSKSSFQIHAYRWSRFSFIVTMSSPMPSPWNS